MGAAESELALEINVANKEHNRALCEHLLCDHSTQQFRFVPHGV